MGSSPPVLFLPYLVIIHIFNEASKITSLNSKRPVRIALFYDVNIGLNREHILYCAMHLKYIINGF